MNNFPTFGKLWMEIRPFRFGIWLDEFSPELEIGATVDYQNTTCEITHMELTEESGRPAVAITAEVRRIT